MHTPLNGAQYLFSSMFNPLHSSVNQHLFEKLICNQVITMKHTGDFSITKESYLVPTKNLTLFTASKDEWDTKEFL